MRVFPFKAVANPSKEVTSLPPNYLLHANPKLPSRRRAVAVFVCVELSGDRLGGGWGGANVRVWPLSGHAELALAQEARAKGGRRQRRAQPFRRAEAGRLALSYLAAGLALKHGETNTAPCYHTRGATLRDTLRASERRESDTRMGPRILEQVARVAVVSVPLAMLVALCEECVYRGLVPLLLVAKTGLPVAAVVGISAVFCGVRRSCFVGVARPPCAASVQYLFSWSYVIF